MPAISFPVFNVSSLSSVFCVSVLDRVSPPWDSTENTILYLTSPLSRIRRQLQLSYQRARNDRAFLGLPREKYEKISSPDNNNQMTPGKS